MVADLVDENVAHDMGEILAGLAPIIEDRPAVEEDHVDGGARRRDALMRQRDAAIEAEQVERAVEPHLLLGLLIGEILEADDDRAEMPLELAADRCQRALRQRLELGKAGWDEQG